MKKKALSLILTLLLCLGLLPGTALAADYTLDIGETATLTCPVSSPHYDWRSDDSSIVSLENRGSTCVIKGKRAGATVIWVFYEVDVPYPAMENGQYITKYTKETENMRWGVIVKDPSAPEETFVLSELPEPNQSYGTAGQDVSNMATDIKDFSNGLAPVMYNGLWGLADSEMELVFPFQFEKIGSWSDAGYIDVKLNSRWYVIDAKGNVVYTHSPSSKEKKVNINCHFGHIWVTRDYGGGVTESERYSFDGEKITYSQAMELNHALERQMEKRGDLKHCGYDSSSGDYLFCLPTDQYKDKPATALRIERSDEWEGVANDLQEGLFVVKDRDTRLYGAVDASGDLAVPCEYDYLGDSRDGYLSYKKGNDVGLLENPVNPPEN